MPQIIHMTKLSNKTDKTIKTNSFCIYLHVTTYREKL